MTDILNEIITIFSGTEGLVVISFYAVGVFLMLVEFCIPGFGAFGCSSIAVLLLGLIYRVITGLNFIQFIILLILEIIVSIIIYAIFIHSIKKGILSKTSMFSSKNSISEDFENRNNRKFLIGKTGTIETSCKPVGKAIINGQVYEVLSVDKYLDKNTKVKVINVVGDIVEVKEI